MTRPFTVGNFFDLQEKCMLALIAKCPLEVAYPDSLSYSPRASYQEGILINVLGINDSSKGFEDYLTETLLLAGRKCEELEANHEGIRPFFSDLCSGKVLWQDGSTSKPIMEILETYSDEDAPERYMQIASDFLKRTRDKRIKTLSLKQERRTEDDLDRLKKSLYTMLKPY
jgi:hypothetical protein